ncbi:hypothetical protein ASF41_13255 [Methylobacterium sp. Leaf111]|uniref:hypothetical protein n=1 Tax=Methylobacterium sp. Leaf111 TaxID=1736257 RepID=UPI0006FD3AB6|nr:hypothetical protein [Methylobacterium sp. Leaf111]KQP51148.1 hypothetical protein ASF41_13255 [Methylobacterium sp. Leaf111]
MSEMTDNDEPNGEATDTRYTPFAPRQRGPMRPALGPVTDASVLAALAASGSGWLHRDGRVLADGGCTGFSAHVMVPDTNHILVAHLKAIADLIKAAEEGRTAAPGEPVIEVGEGYERRSIRDGYGWVGPDRAAQKAIREAGWAKLTLRRDRGVKEILIGPRDKEARFEKHLAKIATHLGCRVGAASPEAKTATIFDSAGEEGSVALAEGEIAPHMEDVPMTYAENPWIFRR